MLVNRFVEHGDVNHWHIRPADWRFPESAIVTLQALCGGWCFGTLTRFGLPDFQQCYPTATICTDCLEVYTTGLEAAWQEEW